MKIFQTQRILFVKQQEQNFLCNSSSHVEIRTNFHSTGLNSHKNSLLCHMLTSKEIWFCLSILLDCCWSSACDKIVITQKTAEVSLLSSSQIKNPTDDKGPLQSVITPLRTNACNLSIRREASAGFQSRIYYAAVWLVRDVTQNDFVFLFFFY